MYQRCLGLPSVCEPDDERAHQLGPLHVPPGRGRTLLQRLQSRIQDEHPRVSTSQETLGRKRSRLSQRESSMSVLMHTSSHLLTLKALPRHWVALETANLQSLRSRMLTSVGPFFFMSLLMISNAQILLIHEYQFVQDLQVDNCEFV